MRPFRKKVSPLQVFLVFLPLFFQAQLVGQAITVVPDPIQEFKSEDLDTYFSEWEVLRFDLPEMAASIHGVKNGISAVWHLGKEGRHETVIIPNNLKSDNFVVTVATPEGLTTKPGRDLITTYKGYSRWGEPILRLTIDREFINGFIEVRDDIIYFENLSTYVEGADPNLVVVYRASNTLVNPPFNCDAQPVLRHHEDEEKQTTNDPGQRAPGDCLEVEIAFANDWLMYEDYNESVIEVENHNMAVMNNVQANYDDEFEEELSFNVVEIFVSTCETCDPWTSSTNAGALLDDFSDWAGNGFDANHDVACLWTDRNFNGATVGLAWVEAVCFNNFKYCTTQDFTSNANFLRVLLAHELGHNFGAFHDASGSNTIMAPSVNSSNSWSNASVNSIDNYVDDINCLSPCPAAQPPLPEFSADITEDCVPLVVEFTDESQGIVDTWSWTFEGGDPATSNDQNPVVTYNEPGTFDVTLEVSNGAGSNTLLKENYITVNPLPLADFDYESYELEVLFEDLSENAESWDWNFGDGQFSNDQNPIHIYQEDGIYDVTLVVTNECGSSEVTYTIEVVSLPIANFSFDPAIGCVPLTVTFTNLSSDNVVEFFWTFEGGSPETSTAENPVVEYNDEGSFTVSLLVTNSAGSDELLLEEIITVEPGPEAGFSYSVDGYEVTFLSTAVNADQYTWYFGDGESSTNPNPIHTYGEGGLFDVMQIATNECGDDTATQVVAIQAPPQANLNAFPTSGCAPFEVQYLSTGSGDIQSYEWSFPGGIPATSTNPAPLVTYNTPGTYSAELIVSNASGADTMIMQDAVVVQEETISAFSFDVQGSQLSCFNESTADTAVIWIIDDSEFTTENVLVELEDGFYDIMLIAMGPCGSDTLVQVAEISTLPTAAFTASTANGCEPLTVQMTNLSSSNASAFQWSFPGGTPNSSTEVNPVVTYPEPGIYSITLVATSTAGSDEVTLTDFIVVNPKPAASFETNQVGTIVQFMNTSLDGDEYFWQFGDGETSDEIDPEHEYGDFGEYLVTLIVTNDCGSDTITQTVNLSSLPVPAFSAEVREGCIPLTVELMDLSQNGAESWQWEFPGGEPATSDQQFPTVTYNAPGSYDITLIVSNAAGSQSLTLVDYITVDNAPVAAFSEVIEEERVEFTSESVDADEYQWDFGDGASSTDQNPVHVYAGSGTYLVTLVVSNVCSSDTIRREISVTTTGLEIRPDKAKLTFWPNPTQGVLYLNFLEAPESPINRLSITSADGRVVWSLSDSDRLHEIGRRTLEVNLDCPPGIYFLGVYSRRGVEIRPLIVQ